MDVTGSVSDGPADAGRGRLRAWRGLAVLLAVLGLGLMPAGHARAAPYADLVIDANSGKVLHESNADAPRFPASLTKMMTLYVLFEMLDQGRLTLETDLVVTANAAAAQPSKLGLAAGERIKVRDAMRALVTKSANDVALTIAENIGGTEAKFAKYMTWRAKKLGMRNTVFRNASGLPDLSQKSTARDLVKLALHLHDDFPKYWGVFKTAYFNFRGKRYKNHNSLLFNFPGTDGLKTGYTRASGFNLVTSVRRGGKHVIGAIFGGRTAGQRSSQMRKLLKVALAKATTRKTRSPVPVPDLVAARAKSKQKAAGTVVASAKSKKKDALKVALAAPAPAEPAAGTRRTGLTDFVEKLMTQSGLTKTQTPTAFNVPEPEAAVPPEASATVGAGDAEQQASLAAPGPFHLQIGAYDTRDQAFARLTAVQGKAGNTLGDHLAAAIEYNAPSKVWYRARFAGFEKKEGQAACASLKKLGIECIVMRAE